MDEIIDMKLPAESDNEIRAECSKIEQTFPSDSGEIEKTLKTKEISFHSEDHRPKEDQKIKEDFNLKEDINTKEDPNPREDFTNEEDISTGEDINIEKDLTTLEDLNTREDVQFKEDLNPKEDNNIKEDNNPKEVNNPKEDNDPKEDNSPREDNNPKEHNNSKEDQPNYTNRWSLQEHPNKGTPVRNSPSLGSIPKHKRASKCSKDELSDLPETWDEECQKHLVDFAER